MTGDQESDHLIADVLVAQLLAGDGIDAVEHEIEEVVLVVALGVAAPFGDQFPSYGIHEFLVGLELARLGQHEGADQLRPPRAFRGFLERSHHGGHEGMHLVLVEAVEAVVEGAQRNRVERQARHVVGDIDDGIGAEPLPAHEHLVGDVEHVVEHAADGDRPEGGHEYPVGLGPVRFVAVGREQAVAGDGADFLQRRLDALAESGLVAELVDQFLRACDVDVPVDDRELEEGPVSA